jgi:hypothetical protein
VILHPTIKNNLVEITLSFLLYWIFFGFTFLIPALKSSPITYFVFMPAGMKLFAILIFRWRGALGSCIGIFSRLMLMNSAEFWGDWLLLAMAVSLALYALVELTLRCLRIDRNLDDLNYYQIVLLATLASLGNGVVYAYTYSKLSVSQLGDESILHAGYLTFMGNFAGNAVFVCAAVFLLRKQDLIKSLVHFKK